MAKKITKLRPWTKEDLRLMKALARRDASSLRDCTALSTLLPTD